MSSKKTENKHIARGMSVIAAITPLAMAHMSDDLFQSSISYSPKTRFPLINYFLFAASIELGLKAAILAKDCNKQNKKIIKNINHDLDKLIKEFEENYHKKMFADDDLNVISQVNKFYYKNSKSLEYFTTPMLEQALIGYRDFPQIKKFREIALKVNKFLHESDLFINAHTSEKPKKGIFVIN